MAFPLPYPPPYDGGRDHEGIAAMWRYLGRRLIQVPLVLIVVSLMTFLITRATPGDPVQIMLGMQTSKEAADAMRKEFNLDRSLPEQYGL